MDIIDEVARLETITTDERSYTTIQYYLGGDWKFLALVTSTHMFTSNLIGTVHGSLN